MTANTFGSLAADFKQTYPKGKNMFQPKLGSGERFKNLKNMLSKKPGIKDPGALAAEIGRKKLGNKHFQNLAIHGKHKHAK